MKEADVYRKKKSKAKPILLFVLLFFVILGSLTYIFVIQRPIFKLNSEAVAAFSVRNGDTGVFVEIEDEAAINEIIDFLNSFRCRYMAPKFPLGTTGWSYMIVIYYNNDTLDSYEFNSEAIQAGNFWYVGGESSFEQLIEIVS